MMDYLKTYTSMGNKLIHHPANITEMKMGMPAPISMQVAPTSRCNLKCSFCSNVNRSNHEDLEFDWLIDKIEYMKQIGLEAVEISGGGEPTLWEPINDLIQRCSDIGITDIGLITNGILLRDKIEQKNLDKLKWVRISMNCLDYVDKIDIPKIDGTLGFSYVMNEDTELFVLGKIKKYAEKSDAKYIRIVPNCQATHEEQKTNNRRLSSYIAKLGKPFFYQAKEFEKPRRCWWGYVKPFLLHNKYFYRCSSVVLNDSADRQFHDKFKWFHGDDIKNVLDIPLEEFDPVDCTHCVFTDQNNLVDDILNPDGMEAFV